MPTSKSDEQDMRLELYKLMVEMADRVSQRRQAANSFYLSVNTLVASGSAYLRTLSPTQTNALTICIAGLAICALWVRNIGSYKTLNEAKFEVINELELTLPYKPFTLEWSKLDPNKDGIRHRPFHSVEVAVPWVFIVLYIFQAMSILKLQDFIHKFCF